MDSLKVDGGALYQWDSGRRIEVTSTINCTVDEVEFENPFGDTALVVELKTEGDRIFAPIPNILLQRSGHLIVYAVTHSADGKQTIRDYTFGINTKQKPSDYVYTETEVYSIKTALEKALREAKESGDFTGPEGKQGPAGKPGEDGKDGQDGKPGKDGTPCTHSWDGTTLTVTSASGTSSANLRGEKGEKGENGLSEWDYVITSIDDFTTEHLASMSGRVLIKGINSLETEFSFPVVKLPSGITLIKFVDSEIYADIQATKGAKTKIIGFVGFYAEGLGFGKYSCLRNFESVESCEGFPMLYNCTNIQNSKIHLAENCQFISNVHCRAEHWDGDYIAFTDCTMLSNITFVSFHESMGSAYQVDFLRCKHLSNIHALSSDVIINYENCIFVDGETCDGFYTEEDVGKVRVITTDGSFRTIPNGDEVAY